MKYKIIKNPMELSIYDKLLKLEGEIDVLYLRSMLLNEEAYYKRIKIDRIMRIKISSKKIKNIFHIKIAGNLLTDLAEKISMNFSQLINEIHIIGHKNFIWKNTFHKGYDQFEFKVEKNEKITIKLFLINCKDLYYLDKPFRFILREGENYLSRTEILTRMWQYAKDNSLFKNEELICDDKLQTIFKEDRVKILDINYKLNPLLREMEPLEFHISNLKNFTEAYDVNLQLDDLKERPSIYYDEIDVINKLNCKAYNVNEHISILKKKLVNFDDFLINPSRAIQYWIIFDLIELVNKNDDIFKNNRSTFYNKNIQRAIFYLMKNLK